MKLSYRWLGAAGLELKYDGFVLLIDPFLTRPSPWKILARGGVKSDTKLISMHIPRADVILISHTHYDHFMDVPEIMRFTGAVAFGSANACKLLALFEFPPDTYSQISVGNQFAAGPFSVEVFRASHTRTPLDHWINGPIPERIKSSTGRLRLIDYRMDECFSFRIQVGKNKLMIGNQPAQANVIFISPYQSIAALEQILDSVQPDMIVPVHWDNFTRPLSVPLRPMLVTRWQGSKGWPLIRFLDLGDFSKFIYQKYPGVKVVIPRLLQEEFYESG